MSKRIIDREKYSMVLDWSEYKNTHTKLPCKCQHCGLTFKREIAKLDKHGDCYCISCGQNVKRKNNFIEKYGVENPFQLQSVKEKIKKTNLEKYGVEYNSQSQSVKEKKIETNLKKLGVSYPIQAQSVKDKMKETNLIRYGVEHTFQSKELKETRKKNNKEKYGVEYTIQLDYFKEKRKKTCLKKYGVPNPNQRNRELWQIDITSSKENFENYLKSLNRKITTHELSTILGFGDRNNFYYYISNWGLWGYIDSSITIPEKELSEYILALGFIHQKKRFKFGEIDIFIPELNIGFEFNGNYWHGNPQFYRDDSFVIKNGRTIKEIREKDKKKIDDAKKVGITIYTIWENDWGNNQEETKNKIKSILKIN